MNTISSECFTPAVLFTEKTTMLVDWRNHRMHTLMFVQTDFRLEDLKLFLTIFTYSRHFHF
jgi:hypothetical protein